MCGGRERWWPWRWHTRRCGKGRRLTRLRRRFKCGKGRRLTRLRRRFSRNLAKFAEQPLQVLWAVAPSVHPRLRGALVFCRLDVVQVGRLGMVIGICTAITIPRFPFSVVGVARRSWRRSLRVRLPIPKVRTGMASQHVRRQSARDQPRKLIRQQAPRGPMRLLQAMHSWPRKSARQQPAQSRSCGLQVASSATSIHQQPTHSPHSPAITSQKPFSKRACKELSSNVLLRHAGGERQQTGKEHCCTVGSSLQQADASVRRTHVGVKSRVRHVRNAQFGGAGVNFSCSSVSMESNLLAPDNSANVYPAPVARACSEAKTHPRQDQTNIIF